MKYSFRFLGLIAAASIVFFSCEKETALDVAEEVPETTDPATEEKTTPEENTEFDPSEYLLSFGASFENDAQTKVDIAIGASKATFTFKSGDEARACNDEASAVYVYDGEKFAIKAGETPIAFGVGVQVFYPADEFSADAGTVTFTMPAAIEDVDDLGAKNPLAGKISGSAGNWSVTFKAVGSILQVGVTGDRELNSLTLSNTALDLGEGAEFTIGWDGENPTMATAGTSNLSMTITGLTQALSSTAATYYFLLPAGIAYEGLKVTAGLGSADQGGFTTFDIVRGNGNVARNKVMTMSFYAGLFSGGDGLTEGTAYVIANARDFKHIYTYSNGGYGSLETSHFLGAYYKQTADISFGTAESKGNLSSYMIGLPSTTDVRFSGTYDGQNYKLQNFSLSGTAVNTGLWKAAYNATFKNIHVDGATVSSTKGYVGAIVANQAGNDCLLQNCIVTNTTVSGTEKVGGICGRSTGTITDCTFGADGQTVSVTGTTEVGGILGNHSGTGNVSECVNYGAVNCSGVRGGGIIGVINNVSITVSDCTNHGAVGTAANYKGGIIGSYYSSTENTTLTITNAVNHGTVSGQSGVGGIIGGTDNADGEDQKNVNMVINGVTLNDGASVTGTGANTGGIIGFAFKTILTIGGTSCTNNAAVTGKNYVGGIVGQVAVEGSISSCTNSGAVKATVTDANAWAGGIVGCAKSATIILCDNAGTVTGARANVGGIVGEMQGGKIDRCTNQKNVTISVASQNNAGGIGGYVNGATIIKRCYSFKAATISGGTRIGGIVGNLVGTAQVVNCAAYGQVRGARTGAVGTFGIGTIAGCQSGTSLIANCLARDNGVHVQNTGSDTQLAGGIVGWRDNGTLQNCYTAGVLNNIRSKSKNGPDLGAYVGQICGKSSGGTIKDCYYRGHTNGARDLGTASSDTNTDNITCLSENTTTGYSYGFVPVEVTTSAGNTFAAGSVYLKDILNGGLTAGGIEGYTPEEGESMEWEDLSESSHYPVPSALKALGTKFYTD